MRIIDVLASAAAPVRPTLQRQRARVFGRKAFTVSAAQCSLTPLPRDVVLGRWFL